MPFSKAYRWNSLLLWTTTSRYVLSTGTVWESLCPAQRHALHGRGAAVQTRNYTPFVHGCSNVWRTLLFLRCGKPQEEKMKDAQSAKRLENTVSRGPSGEAKTLGSGIARTYMALCGLECVGGDTSRPLALSRTGVKDGVGPCASPICGAPTSEMSNARLVGPAPAPNDSDWPARAVCAPRCFCRSEGVVGAWLFKYLGRGPSRNPCPGTRALQRSGWKGTCLPAWPVAASRPLESLHRLWPGRRAFAYVD
jgi:hypothetical protein